MSEKTRRDVLKMSAVAAGTGLFSTVGAARKRTGHNRGNGKGKNRHNRGNGKSKNRVVETETIVDESGKTIAGVIIDNDGTKEHYIGQVDAEQENVKVKQTSQSQYQSMTSGVGTMSYDTAERQISTMDSENEDVIKRFEVYKNTNGDCGAYDYTHRRDRIAFELFSELDEVGAGSVAAALSSAIGASSLGGPATVALTGAVTFVLLGGAALTEYTSYTIGAIEFDKGAWGHTQTMSGAKWGTGYGVTMPNLIPAGYTPGHPGRL
ncbi:twin-arginine translocation signal domain-containing protein [Halorhabdus rudnickae]|uniref:twin-arginine translocation signal domain-containing protein n=1 Tax=Halorhabdus rudnickae TaxID=1775544 RepID=UPI00108341A4|nr:twin-arginine translocation signal domain-containing protein [Halorhabdus rudnickae]